MPLSRIFNFANTSFNAIREISESTVIPFIFNLLPKQLSEERACFLRFIQTNTKQQEM